MDDFMIQQIPGDFEVEVLVENEDSCLFYGFRQGHIHFLKYYDNYISQFHIPRFLLAFNLNLLYEKLDLPGVEVLYTQLCKGFMITIASKDSFIFKLGSREFQLRQEDAPEFFKGIHQDVRNYQEAKGMVKYDKDGGGCFVEDIFMTGNTLLRSDEGSVELMAAIAFEYMTYKDIKTSESLSAWSLYRDWLNKEYEVADEWFMELAPGLQYLVEGDADKKMLEIYLKLQLERHLSAFSPDEAVALGNYADLIYFAYKKLSSIQKIQFKTLAELHGANFILPLALITGVIEQRDYNDLVNMDFQPDSKEEQKTRYETAVVEAFGGYF